VAPDASSPRGEVPPSIAPPAPSPDSVQFDQLFTRGHRNLPPTGGVSKPVAAPEFGWKDFE
jgi:hypothetical protein